MWRNTIHSVFLATLFACALSCQPLSAQVIWSSPWTYSTPMPLDISQGLDLAFTADGGVIVSSAAETGFDQKTTRINPDGSLKWASSLYGYRGGVYQNIGSSIEMEDGGAIVTLKSETPYASGEISRLDAAGNIQWSRNALVARAYRLGASRLAYANCNVLTVADIQTGNVLWQRSFDKGLNCQGGNAAVDGSDNVYASFAMSTGFSITGYRVVHTNAQGDVQWNVTAQITGGGSVAGIGTSVIYVQTETDLRALSKIDGSTLWSAPIFQDSKILVSDDIAADPVVIDYNSIRRLSSTSGSEVWNVALSPCVYCSNASTIGNAVISLTNSGLGLIKLDASTGATMWTSTLPTTDANSRGLTWKGFGGLANNHLLGVATAYAAGARTAHFQGIDFDTGVMTSALTTPPTVQGVYASSVADGNDVFDAGYGSDQSGKTLRLRRLDTTTGAPIWATSVPAFPAQVSYYSPGSFDRSPTLVINADSVAIAYAASFGSGYNDPGLTYVTLLDRTTGTPLWSKLLQEEGQTLTYTSAPEFDGAGNVFIGVGTNLPCNFNDHCGRQFIYKLSAQTGDVLWRFDRAAPPSRSIEGSGQVFPQTFELFNNDVIVAGTFSGTTHTLLRISGVDASLMWSSDLFAGGTYSVDFYRQDDQHIIVSSWPQSARVDVSNGNVIWTSSSAPFACTQTCYTYGQLVLPGGDLISVGEGDSKASISRAHNDGSGQVDHWQIDPGNPSIRSIASFVRQTPSGKTMVQGSHGFRTSAGKLYILYEIDPTNGGLLSQQVISSRANDATSESLLPLVTKFVDDNHMLFNGFHVSETLPWTSGAGLLDTTIVAHGNLQLSIITDHKHVVAGQTLGFQLLATYTGDQPISGAQLIAGTLLQGGTQNLTCVVQAASNCVIDNRSGTIDATFDIQPGGSVTISGELKVVEMVESSYLSGTLSGPVSLSESSTVDNFSRSNIVQALFANGFEAAQP